VARGNQTFHKRQRENKLREKAQEKRERRQQKQAEKRQARAVGAPGTSEQDSADETGALDDIAEVAAMQEGTGGWTLDQADSKHALQSGGIMASKLFVGNLPRGVTDNSLAEFVTDAGFRVASAVVIRDRMSGEPKGFGFVELEEGEDLQKAIRGLDGQMLEGRRLNVNEARPQRTGFSGPRGGGGGGGRPRGGFGGKRRGY
jgi:cold-inducible RNA-binding protein